MLKNKNKTKMSNSPSSEFVAKRKALMVFGVAFFLSMLLLMWNDHGLFFKASVVNLPEHQSFDGTVSPIKKVPNWVKLPAEKWKADYSSLSSSDLIDIPFYDPAKLKIGTDSLKWGNAADDAVRNAKITYSTPYMGNYKLDGVEYAGSHLAVDIKIPMKTPVYAIANGVVTKAVNTTTGFGVHAVVQHKNFPTLEDSEAKETIYSSYSHLDSLLVKEGDVVKKGQQIGLSGASGTATTPHLHFQIDNSSAPWHPYWPFTNKEAVDAGLDFFTAVNAGLGSDKAISTTINPVKYVQRYASGAAAPDVVSENSDEATVPTVESKPEIDEDVVLGDSVAGSYAEDVVTSPSLDNNSDSDVETPTAEKEPARINFTFDVKETYYTGKQANFAVYLRDQYGENFTEGFNGDIIIMSDRGFVRPKSPILRYLNFKNYVYDNEFERMNVGRDRLKIEYGDDVFYSEWFEVVEGGGGSEEATFSDVKAGSTYYDAVAYLSDKDIITGYSDGTFRPSQKVSRAEAVKLILEGTRANLESGNLPFKDTPESEWYAAYVNTALRKKIVQGYEDSTFRPNATVNRAEFYKILLTGMGVKTNKSISQAPFKDVDLDDWFVDYAAYAKEKGIIDKKREYFSGNDDMTRGEVAESIYRVMKLR